MKTSTKNAIIEGVFTLIAGFIGGFFVGHNLQNSEIKDIVKQSGLVNINQNDSSHDIIMKLLDAYLDSIDSLKEENNALKEENNALKNKEEESTTTDQNTESPVIEEEMSVNPHMH